MQSELLTPADAARFLKISVGQVQRLCKRGRLGRRLGRVFVITPKELARFAEIPRLRGRPRLRQRAVAR